MIFRESRSHRSGGTYLQDLKKHESSTQVLIGNPDSIQWHKAFYAKDRSITLVRLDWFLQSLVQGRPLPSDGYQMPQSAWQRLERERAENQDKIQEPAAVPRGEAATTMPNAIEQNKR